MSRLWVEKNKDGSWDAFSDDGAHIKFGHSSDRGLFSPGDLVKVALAGCAALSSEMPVESVLGEGTGARIVVDGTYDSDADAYTSFEEQIVVDATKAGLSEEDAKKLAERVRRHIESGCTVMHTYREATPVRMNVEVRR
ncbi:MAG: OsmC family peroxiredoxin [Bifidobacteriaceae bacterium]|nr:OsmC family peroxiredoxin [Bifidobacteriaceae bacterium]